MNARERFSWMVAVCADTELTPAQKVVLIRLALYFNLTDGRCDPSISTLATGTNLSERAVRMALARGEALGRLVREIGGGNRNQTNRYSLTASLRNGDAGVNGDAARNDNAPLNDDALLALNGHGLTRAPPCQTHLNGGAAKQKKRNREENREDASRNSAHENLGVGKTYAFQGQQIRLLPAQFKRWQAAYPNIPDLAAALQRIDDYYAEHPPSDGKWFFRVSRWLEQENSKMAERRLATEREQHSW